MTKGEPSGFGGLFIDVRPGDGEISPIADLRLDLPFGGGVFAGPVAPVDGRGEVGHHMLGIATILELRDTRSVSGLFGSMRICWLLHLLEEVTLDEREVEDRRSIANGGLGSVLVIVRVACPSRRRGKDAGTKMGVPSQVIGWVSTCGLWAASRLRRPTYR